MFGEVAFDKRPFGNCAFGDCVFGEFALFVLEISGEVFAVEGSGSEYEAPFVGLFADVLGAPVMKSGREYAPVCGAAFGVDVVDGSRVLDVLMTTVCGCRECQTAAPNALATHKPATAIGVAMRRFFVTTLFAEIVGVAREIAASE